MEKSNSNIIKELVTTLGKDAGAKVVIAKFREQNPDNLITDSTLTSYVQNSRKELGYTRVHAKSEKRITVDASNIKAAQVAIKNSGVTPEQYMSVLSSIEEIGDIQVLKESVKILTDLSLDA